MDFVLSSTEIWQLAVIKLLFYLFVGLGLIFFIKIKKPILLVGLIAFFRVSAVLFMILFIADYFIPGVVTN